MTRVLVAGVGNIFFGDDGFGVEVARRLAVRALPDGVRVADFGIRSLHLAYELLDHPDALVVLADVTPRGGAPGTLYVIDPDEELPAEPVGAGDAHALTPNGVRSLVRSLGGIPNRLLVVGCEPAATQDGIGLSGPVADAVEPAADLILSVIARVTNEATRACV